MSNSNNIVLAFKPLTSFKRLEIGMKFRSEANGTNGQTFRKVSKRGAFRIKDNGQGETHAQVPFSRSHAVSILGSGLVV